MIHKLKRSFHLSILSLLFVLFASLLPYNAVHAETLSDHVGGTYVFAVPDGGWNTAKILLRYEEDYYPLSSFPRNLFSWREQTYYYKFTGMSSGNIRIDLSNFLHTDGTNNKVIYPSGSGDTLFDPTEWDWCGVNYNSEGYEYTNTTNYKGQVTYVVYCIDGMPAEYLDSVVLPFRTQ